MREGLEIVADEAADVGPEAVPDTVEGEGLVYAENKTGALSRKPKKGYIYLGMSKRMFKRVYFFELTNERWEREEFSTNEELHNPTPIPRISF